MVRVHQEELIKTMKRIIVFLLLLLSHYSFSQNIIYENHLSWLGDDQRVADYVNNYMPQDITVYVIDGPVYRRHLAFVEILPKKTYIVTFSTNMSTLEYLEAYVHEMVHINQYHRGSLIKKGSYMIWEGKKYSKLTPYTRRPWEQEAEFVANRFIN